jgi:hypothetical protein
MGKGPTGCVGTPCDWMIGVGKKAQCVDGGGTCSSAPLLEAELSDFHDAALIKATRKINKILAGLEGPKGHTASFLYTNMGTLLAWTRHGTKAKKGVTAKDPNVVVAKALKLKWVGATEKKTAKK